MAPDAALEAAPMTVCVLLSMAVNTSPNAAAEAPPNATAELPSTPPPDLLVSVDFLVSVSAALVPTLSATAVRPLRTPPVKSSAALAAECVVSISELAVGFNLSGS
jgi:hypothetical protein